MPKCVRVVPDELHLSAAKVGQHAEELDAVHTGANGRIEAAQVGVPTSAAFALIAAVTKWQADTAILHGDLVAHGGALRDAATEYTATENRNAAAVQSVGDVASS